MARSQSPSLFVVHYTKTFIQGHDLCIWQFSSHLANLFQLVINSICNFCAQPMPFSGCRNSSPRTKSTKTTSRHRFKRCSPWPSYLKNLWKDHEKCLPPCSPEPGSTPDQGPNFKECQNLEFKILRGTLDVHRIQKLWRHENVAHFIDVAHGVVTNVCDSCVSVSKRGRPGAYSISVMFSRFQNFMVHFKYYSANKSIFEHSIEG
jgi:hypothetical protein